MSKIRVAVNGFGRIGRLAFRVLFDDPNFEIVAVNNRTPGIEMLAHLLKYDTAQGRFAHADKVKVEGENLNIGGRKINFYAISETAKLPWKQLNVDAVIDCTGANTTLAAANEHLNAGAKRVIISAPAKDTMPTIVFNVNHEILKATDKIISGASCTTNCLAPMAKALDDLAGIEKGVMTTIHAYTGDQNPLDATHKGDFRRARAAAANIVPNTTGAAKAIGLVIPSLKGKLDGSAQRVPVVTGSLTELVAVVNKAVSVEEVNAFMRSRENESFGYTDEMLVSSDIIGSSAGSIFDATQTRITSLENGKSLVKVAAWYDNEMGYTHQLIRTVKYLTSLK